MSAQTNYLREELTNAKADLNNEALRLSAIEAINTGLGLLDSRDKLEQAGVALPAMDATIVAAIYDPIKTAIDNRNSSDVTIKDKATILAELAGL